MVAENKNFDKKQEYKTTRIYPDDLVRLKRLSYFRDKPMVKLFSEALDLLEEKYKNL